MYCGRIFPLSCLCDPKYDLTDSKKDADKIRKWSTQSRESAPWYQHEEIGYNYRMSNIIAGIVRGQMSHLDEHIAQKKAIYMRYKEGFKGLPVKMNPYDEKNSEPNFWLSCMIIDKDDNAQTVTAEVTVKNTGDVAGKHIVELYAQVPYTEGGLEKSAIQLIGFDKTETLQPGEEQTVTISCDYEYFASWDRELEHNGVTGAYVLDAGDYYFATGNGANDALNNVLAAQGYTADRTDGYMTADGDAEKTASVNFGRVEITKSNSGEMYQNQLDNMDLALQIDEVENRHLLGDQG